MHPHPFEKTGRNDPCPCGSGKKYKHCCLADSIRNLSVPDDPNTPWSLQRDASDRLTLDLQRILKRHFSDAAADAWSDFNQNETPDPISEMQQELSIFMPYVLFDWTPEKPLRRSTKKQLGGAVVQAYLSKSGDNLPALERLILEQAITRPVSFYEAIRVEAGCGVVLRDILIGEVTEVEEHTATKTIQPGDVLYAQIWVLPEVATLGRLAPIPITPDRKVEIIRLRMDLQRRIRKQSRELHAADLTRYTDQIRGVYLNLRDAQNRPPILHNTDGELFLLHRIHFKTRSAQATFDALASLAWGVTQEELLEESERNQDGTLHSVQFPWISKGNKLHPTWENTILGHLTISEKKLLIEVNSANRAQRIRNEIERRLGPEAIHIGTETESLQQARKRQKSIKAPRPAEQEILDDQQMSDPDIRRQVEAQFQKQIEGWIHTRIPALGGRTPMQAIADPVGREMVEALVQGWERQNEATAGSGILQPDLSVLRRLLDLPVRSESGVARNGA